MLQGDFFTIVSMEKTIGSADVVVTLHESHSIFKGHFPGQPVVPGACLLQMIKEMMQDVTGAGLQLTKAHHLKFISLIDPSKHHVLQVALTYNIAENGEIAVVATISCDTITCFKFNGLFRTDK